MKGVTIKKVNEIDGKYVYNIFHQKKDKGIIGKETIHNGPTKYYPFKIINGKIRSKYKKIKCIILKDRTYPKPGFSTNANSGFGFTNVKGLPDLSNFLDSHYPDIDQIEIIKQGNFINPSS